MTLESPSRVRSYEEQRKEGKESRQMRRLLFLAERKKVHHRAPALEKSQGTRRALLLPHANGSSLRLPSCVGVTHRSRDVGAGGPLAVGPGCRRASDFLLFALQLPVLLLPVLHVDQQRDEAVLHLGLQTVFKGGKDGEFHSNSVQIPYLLFIVQFIAQSQSLDQLFAVAPDRRLHFLQRLRQLRHRQPTQP